VAATPADVRRVPSVYIRPWRIDVSQRGGVNVSLSAAEIARTAARALDAAGAPSPASLAIILSDDRELAALNEQHMGERGPTDVLSFPMLPVRAFPPHTGQSDSGPEKRGAADFVLPPGKRQHLGDVVISVERASQQAATGKGGQTSNETWSAADELRLLVTHGTLHICGWDHADAEEGRAMRELEQELLARR
jgi:probable rRNA maturation factor